MNYYLYWPSGCFLAGTPGGREAYPAARAASAGPEWLGRIQGSTTTGPTGPGTPQQGRRGIVRTKHPAGSRAAWMD